MLLMDKCLFRSLGIISIFPKYALCSRLVNTTPVFVGINKNTFLFMLGIYKSYPQLLDLDFMFFIHFELST